MHIGGLDHLAFLPLERDKCYSGHASLRPIKHEDGAEHVEFFNALDPEDVRYPSFMRMRELQLPQLARLTQIVYDREMAFIATCGREPGRFEMPGVVQAVVDPDNMSAKFAIIVRSDCKGKGLGPFSSGN